MNSLDKDLLGKHEPLGRSFFERGAVAVARELLGKGLWVSISGRDCLVEIHEVEAYLGGEDEASHAYHGKTARNWAMFEQGGTCYVYLSYGVHFCMNVVTGKKGNGEAVLLRAGSPIVGTEIMKGRRKIATEKNLLNGPGKLTKALGIGPRYNGRSFTETDFCFVHLNRQPPRITVSPRIGISKARELPFRFYIANSTWISRPKVFHDS